MTSKISMKERFDGYLPVVIDVETSGVDAKVNGLLELGAVNLEFNELGELTPTSEHLSAHIAPFEGCVLDEEALKVTGIKPHHPFRQALAVNEKEALESLFSYIKKALKQQQCRRALLVGHNAHFDLGFIRCSAAV